MAEHWLNAISLFFAGLLAGEELAIGYTVRGPLARLDPRAHIELRQGLIRTLRILVPGLFAAALLFGLAATIAAWGTHATPWRCASIVLLVGFISVTLGGTVPINQAVLTWNPANAPDGWERAIAKWERLDTVRMWLAVGAFAFALASTPV